MSNTNEQIVLNATTSREDGRKQLSCSAAFKLSSESNMSINEIGRICNKHNVKIVGCQLGCFK